MYTYRHHIVLHKHEQRLCAAQFDMLPDLADELGHRDFARGEKLLLVNVGDAGRCVR